MNTTFSPYIENLDQVLTVYTNPNHRQFCKDMLNAGLSLFHYEGEYYWSGPGVKVKSVDEVLALTKVPCIWDNFGESFVVYPTAYSKESLKLLRKNLKESLWSSLAIHYRQGEPYKSIASNCFSAALYPCYAL
jgi:hypothetical protein